MNFFDILYAKNHGEAPSISHFDALFAKYISPAIDIWAERGGSVKILREISEGGILNGQPCKTLI